MARRDFVGAIQFGDDMGFKTSTMISPRDLRKYAFPWHKKAAEAAKSHGKPFILHSCGNLEIIMDDLIDDVGIDAKHSFEDVIMPVAEVKKRWGERVAILGGIDMDVLVRATPDAVRRYTREVIEACAPGGGYALGCGNTVANYIPPENFLAMVDEGWKWSQENQG
jgi:uroporphyrinogen decarboxylase